MFLTELDKLAVIVELPAVEMFEIPVYRIDGIRRVIGVVDTLLVAEDLLTCKS